jgi:hypothetical protein
MEQSAAPLGFSSVPPNIFRAACSGFERANSYGKVCAMRQSQLETGQRNARSRLRVLPAEPAAIGGETLHTEDELFPVTHANAAGDRNHRSVISFNDAPSIW